ncbi:MAG: metal-dependent transcriptional regulator [Chloroflexota bacterium]|nr:metal-dependent transcriptional regulator [Chloroflexota bacterium]
MAKENVEDYLGAIYRLRKDATTPLQLSRLREYFGFSRVSIHEMILKLAQRELLVYHPYRGVTLTEAGEAVATALLRRHRLWERFLTDLLGVPWDKAHEVAGRLEHAAPETVTEQLANLLARPPHPAGEGEPPEPQPLRSLAPGAKCRIMRIASESPDVLCFLRQLNIDPSSCLRVAAQLPEGTLVKIQGENVQLPLQVATVLWVTLK